MTIEELHALSGKLVAEGRGHFVVRMWLDSESPTLQAIMRRLAWELAEIELDDAHRLAIFIGRPWV